MRNGDPRSEAWIQRNLRHWKRDNLAIERALMLIDLRPMPTDLDIARWSDRDAMLAEDYAINVHFNASDNNNRVPACPDVLKLYRQPCESSSTESSGGQD